jgi:hypothetical protein
MDRRSENEPMTEPFAADAASHSQDSPPCPTCGAAKSVLTGQIRPVHTPSGELEDVKPVVTSVDVEWQCPNGHRFWAKPLESGNQPLDLPVP